MTRDQTLKRTHFSQPNDREAFQMAAVTPQPSFLATRRGRLTLALLCAVAFLDFIDASIVNIALPSIRRDLHFSVQSLVWIPGGYLLKDGGFMLLGGRSADLLGRRRTLVAGTVLLGVSSLIGDTDEVLLGVASLSDPRAASPGTTATAAPCLPPRTCGLAAGGTFGELSGGPPTVLDARLWRLRGDASPPGGTCADADAMLSSSARRSSA